MDEQWLRFELHLHAKLFTAAGTVAGLHGIPFSFLLLGRKPSLGQK
jgi:hypothetical protein